MFFFVFVFGDADILVISILYLGLIGSISVNIKLQLTNQHWLFQRAMQ